MPNRSRDNCYKGAPALDGNYSRPIDFPFKSAKHLDSYDTVNIEAAAISNVRYLRYDIENCAYRCAYSLLFNDPYIRAVKVLSYGTDIMLVIYYAWEDVGNIQYINDMLVIGGCPAKVQIMYENARVRILNTSKLGIVSSSHYNTIMYDGDHVMETINPVTWMEMHLWAELKLSVYYKNRINFPNAMHKFMKEHSKSTISIMVSHHGNTFLEMMPCQK